MLTGKSRNRARAGPHRLLAIDEHSVGAVKAYPHRGTDRTIEPARLRALGLNSPMRSMCLSYLHPTRIRGTASRRASAASRWRRSRREGVAGLLAVADSVDVDTARQRWRPTNRS